MESVAEPRLRRLGPRRFWLVVPAPQLDCITVLFAIVMPLVLASSPQETMYLVCVQPTETEQVDCARIARALSSYAHGYAVSTEAKDADSAIQIELRFATQANPSCVVSLSDTQSDRTRKEKFRCRSGREGERRIALRIHQNLSDQTQELLQSLKAQRQRVRAQSASAPATREASSEPAASAPASEPASQAVMLAVVVPASAPPHARWSAGAGGGLALVAGVGHLGVRLFASVDLPRLPLGFELALSGALPQSARLVTPVQQSSVLAEARVRWFVLTRGPLAIELAARLGGGAILVQLPGASLVAGAVGFAGAAIRGELALSGRISIGIDLAGAGLFESFTLYSHARLLGTLSPYTLDAGLFVAFHWQ